MLKYKSPSFTTLPKASLVGFDANSPRYIPLNEFKGVYLGDLALDPSVDALDNAVNEGDLYFNTVQKRLRVYNGSAWAGINEGALELSKIATSDFSAVYTASAGSNTINLGGLAISGAAFSNEQIATNRMSLAKGSATYNLGGI